MAEEYEQLELAEQGQGISSPPPPERQFRASVDVFAARALQEVSRRSMPQAGRRWNEEPPTVYIVKQYLFEAPDQRNVSLVSV